jgi:hypothetical protein
MRRTCNRRQKGARAMQTRITEIAAALNALADDLDAAYAPR